ncbi:hypothetical protein MTTB_07100 [Methanothermobacter tenebrarum]|jgi:hypothetical protein|uniref:Uncharacterized protein n=1 Tax=Methanothermobacter tenebrarum TaxID=680118 RepID=A0ABM7YB63_9EURY|nr:hypothetical protein MTTB_07100 [Methanothermobacter tenebrarum]
MFPHKPYILTEMKKTVIRATVEIASEKFLKAEKIG